MGWTEEQLNAIELRGKNMLVSAAAGSGKTSVLVERIKKLIIEDGVSIDEMLVVTFTNAAAGEMKEKIVRAITAEIEKNPEDSHFLRRQLNSIHKANISTFHAFALEVIRRYFHVISIDPNFKICDDAERAIMIGESMETLFEELFESENTDFREFLDRYATGKSFEQVKKMILELYKTIQSLPEPIKWLEEAVEMLADKDCLSRVLSERILDFTKSSLEDALRAFKQTEDVLNDNQLVLLAGKVHSDIEKITAILENYEDKSFEQVSGAVTNFAPARLVATAAEKEIYNSIKDIAAESRDLGKDIINEIKKEFFASSLKEHTEMVFKTFGSTKCLADMTREFGRIFKAAKEEKNLIDFNDIEHYALDILKNEDVAAEYRDKFAYIFIDEYQDSNLIQDTLVSRIKRENNMFMVGDVKQSIYKFRLAEPEIFMQKYEEYGRGDDELSMRLDLNTNFRCKGNIVNTVNTICLPLIDGYEDSQLHKGVAYEGDLDYPAELHIVDTKDMDEADAEIRDLKAAELEAKAVADIIRAQLGKEISTVSADGSEEIRKITYKDIVVLMRGVKGYADRYYKVLMDESIPAYVDDSDGYFDTLEIEIFMNLLRVIDNRRQDLPLLSVLRAQFMGFSLEELAKIRIHKKKCSYFDAFQSYIDSGEEEALREKCTKAFEKLAEWKKLSKAMPLDEFCWQLMLDSGYFIYAGALPGGGQRQANLRALVDKALKYASGNKGGLYGFINYVESLQARGVPTGQVKMIGENDNVVRIMTIHKSKGLEFPVVILAGMGRKINTTKNTGALSLHKNIGIGLRLVDLEAGCYYKTVLQTLADKYMHREQMEEEKRILYVAITRAKDKLIMTGTVKDAEEAAKKFSVKDSGIGEAAATYLDLAAPAFYKNTGDMQDTMKIYEHNRLYFYKSGKAGEREEIQRLKDLVLGSGTLKYSKEEFDEIARRFSYEYEGKADMRIKAKYSVTELNEYGREDGEIEKNGISARPLSVPEFAAAKKGFSPAQRGTIMHTAFEHLDFAAAEPTKKYMDEYMQSLVHREILTQEEADTVNIYKLTAFLRSDIGGRAQASANVYKETPFNLLMSMEGRQIMVQGIIDCYFEEINQAGEKEYVLVDYKTNYIGEDELAEEDEDGRSAGLERMRRTYKKQIEVYRQALEDIKHIKVKESYLYLIGIETALRI